jgi:DNA-binding response OmpR family regulator
VGENSVVATVFPERNVFLMSKVLLVEDDNSLREIYGVRLKAEGYDVISAGNGEEALAVTVREKPDLIISDVMMPKISGFEMLDLLRGNPGTKDVKVIMMTALSSDEQRARGEKLGANRYLVKSQVGIEDLVRVVHEVIGDQSATTAQTQAAPQAQMQSAPSTNAAELWSGAADVVRPSQSNLVESINSAALDPTPPTPPQIPTNLPSPDILAAVDPVQAPPNLFADPNMPVAGQSPINPLAATDPATAANVAMPSLPPMPPSIPVVNNPPIASPVSTMPEPVFLNQDLPSQSDPQNNVLSLAAQPAPDMSVTSPDLLPPATTAQATQPEPSANPAILSPLSSPSPLPPPGSTISTRQLATPPNLPPIAPPSQPGQAPASRSRDDDGPQPYRPAGDLTQSGGLGERVIQPITEALNPKIDLDSLLAKQDASDILSQTSDTTNTAADTITDEAPSDPVPEIQIDPTGALSLDALPPVLDTDGNHTPPQTVIFP